MLRPPLKQAHGQLTAERVAGRRWIGLVTLTVVLGVAYFITARLSLLLVTNTGAVIFWPAAGISTGALIALGRDARWLVAVATFTATIAANLTNGRPTWISILFSLCTTGEALLVAWLIEYRFGRYFSLGRFRHVLAFIAAAIVAAGITAAAATLIKLMDNPNQPVWIIWEYWFSGDVVGLIAVAPVIIGLVAAVQDLPARSEVIEGTAAVTAIGITTQTIILLLPQNWWEMCLLVAVLSPLLLWPAARCRPVFASASVFAVCMVVIVAFTFDIGYFNKVHQSVDELEINADITIVGIAFYALILASLFAERAEISRRLQQALSAGSVLAFEWDMGSDVSQRSYNAAQILGFDQQQLATGTSFVDRISADDRERYKALLSNLCRDNPSYSTTYRFARPDGREIWLKDTAKADFDAQGRLLRLSGLGVDVTELKQAQMAQDFLVAELDHRVKNLLSVIAAIATQTCERSNSMEDFIKKLDGRLQSMASAHSLLSQGRWQGVGIADLIRGQVAPYATGTNITIDVSNIILTAAAAQALGMVVHELVTNAVKFGALSTPAGRVVMTWDTPAGDGTRELTFAWRELGGPRVSEPIQSGFGGRLVRELIPHELGGAVDLTFDPDGVSCRIRLPL